MFDEIGDDLRAERMQNLLRRYGVLLVLVLVLVLAGVGGWQFWRGRQGQQADQVAASFMDAMRQADGRATVDAASPARLEAASAFEALARTAPDGYAVLSRLRAAALRAGAGDLPAALALWDQVAGDAGTDPLLRDLARLMWVEHQVDGGDPAAVEQRLAPLVVAGNAWRPLALEQQALLAMRTGRDGQARDILSGLRTDALAPDGARNRAGALLSRMDASPGVVPGAGG